MQLIIGNYIIENDEVGYKVSTLSKSGPKSKNPGTEIKINTVYPGTLGRAFEIVLQRKLSKKDKITATELLEEYKALRDEADKLAARIMV